MSRLQKIRLEYLLNFVYGKDGKYANKEADSALRDLLEGERDFEEIRRLYHLPRDITKAVRDILNDKTL